MNTLWHWWKQTEPVECTVIEETERGYFLDHPQLGSVRVTHDRLNDPGGGWSKTRYEAVRQIAYYSVIPQHGGSRPNSGRPRLDSTGERRYTHSIHVTAAELAQVKEFLAGLRKSS